LTAEEQRLCIALAQEREKVDGLTLLLAECQQQQEDLTTPLRQIRTLTKDVEILAIIDATLINLK
jgi:hypothetical protein